MYVKLTGRHLLDEPKTYSDADWRSNVENRCGVRYMTVTWSGGGVFGHAMQNTNNHDLLCALLECHAMTSATTATLSNTHGIDRARVHSDFLLMQSQRRAHRRKMEHQQIKHMWLHAWVRSQKVSTTEGRTNDTAADTRTKPVTNTPRWNVFYL